MERYTDSFYLRASGEVDYELSDIGSLTPHVSFYSATDSSKHCLLLSPVLSEKMLKVRIIPHPIQPILHKFYRDFSS